MMPDVTPLSHSRPTLPVVLIENRASHRAGVLDEEEWV
jgi:hypothetical protein